MCLVFFSHNDEKYMAFTHVLFFWGKKKIFGHKYVEKMVILSENIVDVFLLTS